VSAQGAHHGLLEMNFRYSTNMFSSHTLLDKRVSVPQQENIIVFQEHNPKAEDTNATLKTQVCLVRTIIGLSVEGPKNTVRGWVDARIRG
jgi:hypothetical protein